MTANYWDFPKDWPTRKNTLKAPTSAAWEFVKPGFYRITYDGHDLRITKKRGSNSWEKYYTAWIDGVPVVKSASLPEAKRLAVGKVDGTHNGCPIVPLDADEIETAEPWPDAIEHRSETAEPPPSIPDDMERQNATEPGTLYFAISGKLDVSSLSTLKGMVALLRESGTVTCTVTLPSRVTL